MTTTVRNDSSLGSDAVLRRNGVELAIISFIVLFQELAFIRWLPCQVRVLAYFPNVVLLSAFLGLGIGSLRARQRSLLWLWPVSLTAVVAVATALGRIAFTQESVSEHLWLLYYDIPHALVVNGVRIPIVTMFVFSGLSFIPLGQLVASRLLAFSVGGVSLWGYCCDLLGSLAGVIAFALASFAHTFPVIWFDVILIASSGFFLGKPRRTQVLFAACAVVTLVLIIGGEKAARYSPYYAIKTREAPAAAMIGITVNGSLHQYATAVARSDVLDLPYQESVREGYHAPYRLLRRPPKRVLVLGAGSGNDVAVALDEGAVHVDAIEIDPVILDIGRDQHPDHPYASSRVTIINTDARQFLNRTDEHYDLIVFGTLDSMTRLSALSSVRLDNFVYTTDCLQAARQRLTPDGGIVMYFMVGSDYIRQRLIGMLTSAFGQPPLVSLKYHEVFNNTFMAGPAFLRPHPEPVASPVQIELPSDDWPFLYLRSRGVSWFYTSLILTLAFGAVGGIALSNPAFFCAVGGDARGSNAEMFLFGVGFLLLETKSVTEMNLIWGVTWVTSAVVFGSILVTLLAATVMVQLRPMSWGAATAGLVISLLISFAVPVQMLLGRPVGLSVVMSILLIGIPIFFASVCFGARFREHSSSDRAFGWNVLGAVGGGLLEFSSMAIGFRALSLVALAAYVTAFYLRSREGRRERFWDRSAGFEGAC